MNIKVREKDYLFIKEAILNNHTSFKNNIELKSFIGIFCNLVSVHTIKSREQRLIHNKIIKTSLYGLRINPPVVEAVKEKMIKEGRLSEED